MCRANQEKIQLLNRYEMGTAVYGDTPFFGLERRGIQGPFGWLQPIASPIKRPSSSSGYS